MIVFSNCNVTKVEQRFYLDDIDTYVELGDNIEISNVDIFTNNGFAVIMDSGPGDGEKFRSPCFKALSSGLNKYLEC